LGIIGHLSNYAVQGSSGIWFLDRLSRDVYTPEGQRRLIRWRPLILVLFALQLVGAAMFFSAF
jgi:hypothetical protein